MSAKIQSIDGLPFPGVRGDIDTLVAQLRDQRERSLAERQRVHRPPRLPSRKVLTGIVERLSAALFPNRLSGHDLSEESIDYYPGYGAAALAGTGAAGIAVCRRSGGCS